MYTFEKFAEVAADSPRGLHRAAQLQFAAADVKGARKSLHRAIELDKTFYPAYIAIIELESKVGNNTAAVEYTRRLKSSTQPSAERDVSLGNLYYRYGHYRAAAGSYLSALFAEPNARILVNLYRAHRADRSVHQVLPHLENWMQDNPDDDVVLRSLATAYDDVGRTKDAIASHLKLLERQPDDLGAVNNLASLYQKVGDTRALEFAERANKLAPEHPATLDTLGWVLVQSGKVKRGLKYLRKAAKLDPDLDEVHYHLGIALLDLGQREDAVSELERALKSGQYFDGDDHAKKLLSEMSGG